MNVALQIVADERHPSARNGADEVPLVLDLDRTLIRADLLYECVVAFLRTKPLEAWRFAAWIFRGRAYLKRRLAEAVAVDLSTLPVNESTVSLAEREWRQGRDVYIATASDEFLATRVAMGFSFVKGVIASNGEANLKGEVKAEVLDQHFPQGFDYAGDSRADLPVWRRARRAIVVEATPAVERAAAALGKPTEVIPAPARWRVLLKALRVHQWAKNLLVFVAAILSGQIAQPAIALGAFAAFIALGLIASGTYLINDLWDLSHDRNHRSKRHRPLASGRLSIPTGAVTAAALIAAGLAIAVLIGTSTFVMMLVYLATTLAYSFGLKRVPILDGFVLASLFTLRIAIGIATAGVYASPWLLVFSMFLFASLSFAKRHTELSHLAAAGTTPRNGRGYVIADVPLVLGLGLATGTASILIMVLYLINDAFARGFYGNPHWLWVLPAALFLWMSRIWLVGQRGALDDDPVAYAIKDRVSLALGASLGAAFLCAWAGVPL